MDQMWKAELKTVSILKAVYSGFLASAPGSSTVAEKGHPLRLPLPVTAFSFSRGK